MAAFYREGPGGATTRTSVSRGAGSAVGSCSPTDLSPWCSTSGHDERNSSWIRVGRWWRREAETRPVIVSDARSLRVAC